MFLQVSVCPYGGACVVALRGRAWLLQARHVWLLGRGVRGVCGCSWEGGLGMRGAWLLWGTCMVAPGGWGVCVVAPGGLDMCGCSGGHAWLLPGGHVWLLRGAHMVAAGGACVVAPRGASMGYYEIRRYDQ